MLSKAVIFGRPFPLSHAGELTCDKGYLGHEVQINCIIGTTT